MVIWNETTGQPIVQSVVRCDTFWQRGRGLMFRSRHAIAGGCAYLFVETRESIAHTAIHMLFVWFPIAVIWLNRERRVVDKVLARPFRLWYAPRQPALYYLEGEPALLEQVRIGDQLEFRG
ncbi:MAG: DUF192 domain-containing protein [Anaerolineae bacterium]